MQKSRFIPEIESLRGIAAFSVMVAHCFNQYGFHVGSAPLDSWQPIVNFIIHVLFDENSAVVMFFVLSGYVLGLQLDGMRNGALEDTAAFWIRRLFRIAPAMWLTVVLAYVVAIHYRMPTAQPDLFLNALMFDGKYLLGTLWTLSVEMGCALLFPLLYWLERNNGLAVNLLVLCGLAWMMGIGAVPEWARYLVFFHGGLMVDRIGRLPKWSLYIALAAYAVAPPLCSVLGLSILIWLRVVGIASVIILAFVVHQGAFGKLLTAQPIRFLGRISYSVYLLHFVLISVVMNEVVVPISGKHPQNVVGYQALCALIVVPVTVLLSHGLYSLVERPFNRLGARIASLSFSVRRTAVEAAARPAP
jgi:peptidoglycan/LPS O-acetylase OafA/YrhL